MNKFANLVSIILVLSQSLAMGGDLNYYRKTLPRLKSVQENSATSRISRLQEKMKTKHLGHGLSISGLSDTHENRIYSSLYFKELLEKSLEKTISDEKRNPPIAYNPAWSRDQQIQELAFQKQRNCIANLVTPRTDANGKSVSGISYILDEVYYKLVLPELKTQKAKNLKINGKEQNTLVNDLNSYLATAPLSNSRRTLTDILGKVNDVEIVNGHVQRIIFNKHQFLIEASLPMLLSSRIGEDQAFVDLQGCLADHLRQQKSVLSAKLNPNAESASVDKKLLTWYYEGETEVNSPSEKEFIEKRLNRITSILPYLEEKRRFAGRISRVLTNLSASQTNFMIDLFLRLRNGDVLSEKEFSMFGQDFSEYLSKSTLSPAAIAHSEADFVFYTSISKLLSKLEATLDEEKKNAKSSAEDLRQIYSSSSGE